MQAQTPDNQAFRAWLNHALSATGTSAHALAVQLEGGVNSVKAYLSDPARDIKLSRAAEIERLLRQRARLIANYLWCQLFVEGAG